MSGAALFADRHTRAVVLQGQGERRFVLIVFKAADPLAPQGGSTLRRGREGGGELKLPQKQPGLQDVFRGAAGRAANKHAASSDLVI